MIFLQICLSILTRKQYKVKGCENVEQIILTTFVPGNLVQDTHQFTFNFVY